MFHKLLTFSTMTAVVLHALLGCCVHHAHAGHTHSRGDDSATVEVEHHLGQCQHGHGHDGHAQDGHKASCQHQNNADGSITCDCFDDETIELQSPEPCSGSHGPHESCDESDCNFVANQRDNDVSVLLTYDWSPLLTPALLLSPEELFTLRTKAGSPPDPHSVQLPLRVKTQVWRL